MTDEPSTLTPEPEPEPTPRKPARDPNKMRIHLLVKDDGGPVVSTSGLLVKGVAEAIPIGTDSRWRASCDRTIEMGTLERGTVVPWAVRCPACRLTPEYDAAGGNRPKPGQTPRDLVSES